MVNGSFAGVNTTRVENYTKLRTKGRMVFAESSAASR